MKSYSVYDAKAKLSELIRFVREFGPVVITERGKPVVQVSPLPESKPSIESNLGRLEQMGLLKPAQMSTSSVKPGPRRTGIVQRFLESRD